MGKNRKISRHLNVIQSERLDDSLSACPSSDPGRAKSPGQSSKFYHIRSNLISRSFTVDGWIQVSVESFLICNKLPYSNNGTINCYLRKSTIQLTVSDK